MRVRQGLTEGPGWSPTPIAGPPERARAGADDPTDIPAEVADHLAERLGIADASVLEAWPGHVTPWDGTPEWEREAAAAVCGRVRDFIKISEGYATRSTREQKGRFVVICWTAQMFKHFKDPTPGYDAD
ncbi:hypothetical protein SAMN05428944_5451 [Streptomyces sp. 1222.5]|nr:hypothetical protein BX260_2645 [Streptomyces sp. 5112.2]SEC87780.1 hypothetical protein SAMN05428944_5451 [Streptomyces sp. 1222.5]